MADERKTEILAYAWCSNAEERRRCFILEAVCDNDITPEAKLRFMDAIDKWIVEGKIPGMGELKKLASVK